MKSILLQSEPQKVPFLSILEALDFALFDGIHEFFQNQNSEPLKTVKNAILNILEVQNSVKIETLDTQNCQN